MRSMWFDWGGTWWPSCTSSRAIVSPAIPAPTMVKCLLSCLHTSLIPRLPSLHWVFWVFWRQLSHAIKTPLKTPNGQRTMYPSFPSYLIDSFYFRPVSSPASYQSIFFQISVLIWVYRGKDWPQVTQVTIGSSQVSLRIFKYFQHMIGVVIRGLWFSRKIFHIKSMFVFPYFTSETGTVVICLSWMILDLQQYWGYPCKGIKSPSHRWSPLLWNKWNLKLKLG